MKLWKLSFTWLPRMGGTTVETAIVACETAEEARTLAAEDTEDGSWETPKCDCREIGIAADDLPRGVVLYNATY